MADMQGTCDPKFQKLADILSAQLDSGDDLGASLAVVVEGEMVVDTWGGWADEAKTVAWGENTITNVWSTTKTITNLCALVLVERGQLDPFAPVAKYWPEFAANGKEGIEVRHLLSHTSGVSGWDQPVQVSDNYDWDLSTSKLAAQAPWWEPGTASGYHALNQGHLVGEVVHRVSGKRLGRFLAEEVAGPLGADFHIGLPPSEFGRVANVVPPPPLPFDLESLDPDSPTVKTMTGPAPEASVAWTPEWRQADIGAANGHGNARSVARIQSVVSNGGSVGGVSLLSKDTIDLIFRVQSDGPDVVLGVPLKFGIGYGLPNESVTWIDGGRADSRTCFWGGWGGSIIVNDTARRVTLSYMMNRMGAGVMGNPTSEALCSALWQII